MVQWEFCLQFFIITVQVGEDLRAKVKVAAAKARRKHEKEGEWRLSVKDAHNETLGIEFMFAEKGADA